MAQARIYRPAKTAMQSGRRQTRKWVLEYEPATSRGRDPLMGWTSAADTLNQVRLHFDTIEEARAFADRQGLCLHGDRAARRSAKSRKATPTISAMIGCATDAARGTGPVAQLDRALAF